MMMGKILFHKTSSHEIDFENLPHESVLSGNCRRFSYVIIMKGILNTPSYS